MARRILAALAGLAAVALLAGCTPADAADRTVQTVHLIDVDGGALPDGTTLGWEDDVFGSPVASDPDSTHAFPVPQGATAAATFVSPRGKEHDTATWSASGWLGLTPEGILLPNLKLSGNTEAGSGTPSGTTAVAVAGGDYSTGIAFLDGTQVIEVDYVEITVTGNADPVKATWTWSSAE